MGKAAETQSYSQILPTALQRIHVKPAPLKLKGKASVLKWYLVALQSSVILYYFLQALASLYKLSAPC